MADSLRIIRFEWGQGITFGAVDKDSVYQIEGSIFDDFKVGKRLCSLSDVRLLAPVKPNIIVGVGGNYPSVIKQSGNQQNKEPQMFIRPSTTVIAHLDNIIYPSTSKIVNYGAELGVIMKYKAWNIPEDKVKDYVLGYTCTSDLTAFDLLKEDNFKQMRGKSFPTSQPMGPCIAIGINGDNLHISSKLNGELIEDGSTADMFFSTAQIISYASKYIILEPGDLILTGQQKTTQIHIGDTIEIEMEGIGILKNKVVAG